MAQKPKHHPSKQPCLTWFESIATALLNAKKAFLEALKSLKALPRPFLEALLEALQLGSQNFENFLKIAQTLCSGHCQV